MASLIEERSPERAAAAGVLSALMLAGLPFTVQAWSWEYTPAAGAGVSYESNPLYISDQSNQPKENAIGTLLDGRVNLTGQTGRSTVNLAPRIEYRSYSVSGNGDNFDYTNYFLPLDASRRNPTSEYGLSAEYDRTQTRDTEFQPAIPDNPNQPPPPGAGGYVNRNEPLDYWTVAPYLTYKFSETYLANATVSYAESKYPDNFAGRFDYDYTAANAGLQHVLNPKSTVSVTVDGSHFSTYGGASANGRITNDVDAIGLQAGYQYLVSDTSSFGLTLGGSRSDYTTKTPLDGATGLPCFDAGSQTFVRCTIKGSQTDFVGNVYYRQHSQQTTANFSLGRSIEPYTEGTTITLDRLSAFAIHTVSPRIEWSSGVYYSRQDNVGVGTRATRDYLSIEAGAGWQFMRYWWLRGRAVYNDDSQKNIFGFKTTTDNTLVSLQVEYQGPPRR